MFPFVLSSTRWPRSCTEPPKRRGGGGWTSSADRRNSANVAVRKVVRTRHCHPYLRGSTELCDLRKAARRAYQRRTCGRRADSGFPSPATRVEPWQAAAHRLGGPLSWAMVAVRAANLSVATTSDLWSLRRWEPA